MRRERATESAVTEPTMRSVVEATYTDEWPSHIDEGGEARRGSAASAPPGSGRLGDSSTNSRRDL